MAQALILARVDGPVRSIAQRVGIQSSEVECTEEAVALSSLPQMLN